MTVSEDVMSRLRTLETARRRCWNRRVRCHKPAAGITRPGVILCVTVLIIATVVAGFAALRVYERVLGPELLQTARIAASTITTTATQAMDLGLDPHDFVGMNEFMAESLALHRGLFYAAMLDGDWNLIAATAAARPDLLPVRPAGLACSTGAVVVAEPVQGIVIPLCSGGGAKRWPSGAGDRGDPGLQRPRVRDTPSSRLWCWTWRRRC